MDTILIHLQLNVKLALAQLQDVGVVLLHQPAHNALQIITLMEMYVPLAHLLFKDAFHVKILRNVSYAILTNIISVDQDNAFPATRY